jgi:rfaE bifunctional protein kinase chain/domain
MEIKISPQKLRKIFSSSKKRKIAVIGDVMLDKYVYGDVSRISPEAPVQVVDIKSTEYKLGGAANVANNIKSLEAEPVLIGVIGDDIDGDYFLETMKKQNLITKGIFKDTTRPTTTKTRVIAHSQHILRIDSEKKMDIMGKAGRDILKFIQTNLDDFDSVILQDYNKGVLSKDAILSIISMCREKNKPVYVDPKFDNFFEYKNVTIFKPNRKEIQDVLGIRIDGDDSAFDAGRKLIEKKGNMWYITSQRALSGLRMYPAQAIRLSRRLL